MSAPACPDCKAGKHANCTTGSWDFDFDRATQCPCWARNHATSTPTEDLRALGRAEDRYQNSLIGEGH